MSIFAAIGIPEIWRYDGKNLEMHLLRNGVYEMAGESGVFPKVLADDLNGILKTGQSSPRREFLARIDTYTAALKK